jgi:hypothetical protein
MRERVTALGGDFSAGHTADDQFEVRAHLPTNGAGRGREASSEPARSPRSRP